MKYMKLGSKPDVFQTDGSNIRFVATELATDIVVTVGDVKFFLHKFPLLSKSSRLQRLVSGNPTDESIDSVDVSDIPGGPSAFEICAKFCYGVVVTLNAYNVVPARCAAEYLEMHETLEKGNLAYKIDVFLNSSIFRTWKDSIIVLQSTKHLMPWAEDLKIVTRCVESIAFKASIEPSEVEWSYTYNRKKLASENGLDPHWNGVRKLQNVPKDWWVEDLCELEMDFYKRVITVIRSKGHISGDVLGEALKAYSYRRILGFLEGSGNAGDVSKYLYVLETVVWMLPAERGSVSCSFLLKLLKAACLLDSGDNCKNELVKRIGRQLETASVSDLLIPGSGPGESRIDTVYNVDMVVSIIEEFVTYHGDNDTSNMEIVELGDPKPNPKPNGEKVVAVGRLIDGYLVEIARDPDLPLLKFVGLAEMISIGSRPTHDGLYRAIDMYLKEHPGLTKSEKRRLCNLMDCRKLSPEASMHAVQNERLPLRIVVQVLFFEQHRSNSNNSNSTLLPRENGNSYGSSRSAATTYTEDDTNGAPVADISSFRSMRLVNKSGGSERSSGSSDLNHHHNNNSNNNNNGNIKVNKGLMMPKKILNKIWSGRVSGAGSGENSSSDTSESPGSVNPEETKSTPSRITRHSVS